MVCITAGICEEVVYRGFLMQYFHTLPFHLSLAWAMVASSVIFGIAHLYQGVAGGGAVGGGWFRVRRNVCDDGKSCGSDRGACGDGFARPGDAAGGV